MRNVATKPVTPSVPSRPRRRGFGRRGAARLVAWAQDERLSTLLVGFFVLAHGVLWTAILTQLKAAQDVHYDVAEAFAWGQKFLLGYGKHPPLSGWIAGAWFKLFPATDWSTYGLAMATVSTGILICWAIALRVVDRRRAFFVVLMLALYPIFNFKGFKYNADLPQLITLPLVVLAYLHAFDKRTLRSGILLGLAGALALMTKYWVVTMIGAVGLAALIHPARMLFLRSPAPWAAIVTMAALMIPHVLWLREVEFAPFLYAGGTYSISSHYDALMLVLGYVGHNLALLALPLALAALALAWSPRRWTLPFRDPRAFFAEPWSMRDNASVRRDQALNIWLIQGIVAVGPPLGALAFNIYIKTDWGISLFFLVPLAVVAIPSLRVPGAAVARLAAIWLVLTLLTLALSPQIAIWVLPRDAEGRITHISYSQLSRQLTDLWHQRFHSAWKVAAGYTDVGEQMTFYSPDHPMPLTPYEAWPSGLTSIEEAKREGFIGICEVGEWRQATCDRWMQENAPDGERMVITTRKYFKGMSSAPTAWNVVIVPPGR